MKETKIIIAGDLLPMPCNYDLFSAGDAKALFGERLYSTVPSPSPASAKRTTHGLSTVAVQAVLHVTSNSPTSRSSP